MERLARAGRLARAERLARGESLVFEGCPASPCDEFLTQEDCNAMWTVPQTCIWMHLVLVKDAATCSKVARSSAACKAHPEGLGGCNQVLCSAVRPAG